MHGSGVASPADREGRAPRPGAWKPAATFQHKEAALARRSLLAFSALAIGGTLLSLVGCSSDPLPTPTPRPIARLASPIPTAARPTVVAGSQATALPAMPTPSPAAAFTPAHPSPTTIPIRTPTSGRIVLAYYVPYDSTSWASLETHADQIDYLATQTVFADRCGGITTQDDRTLQAFARSHGIPVLPSIFTYDQAINHKLLTDAATAARAVDILTRYVVEEGYAGLDVDLENIAPADRNALTAFVGQLGAALHARGKLLTMAVPAKTTETKTGLSAAYDEAALAPHVDLVTIMSYDYSWAGGPPGAISPDSWVDRVIGYATKQFPPEKVLMGVGFYGYDWNVSNGGRARALRYPQAEALASRYGASIALDPVTRSATFRYVAQPDDPPIPSLGAPPLRHDIHVSQPPPCSIPTPTPAPPAKPSWELPGQHVVWLENARSLAARLEIVQKHHAAGIAAWRLGQEDPSAWSTIRDWRHRS